MRFPLLLIFIALLASCKKDFEGSRKGNTPPETYTVVDTIIRTGDNRFTSQVSVSWWGTDADGYITGYEFSFDGSNWTATTRQDSTFTLVLPGNSDTFDFNFQVRAIDNNGAKDESPAHLFYPVKNSPPTASFYLPTSSPSRNPLRSFPALKYYWNAEDKDGNNSLDSFELYWNDTTVPPVKIPSTIREILLVGTNISGSTTDCEIYLGISQNAWSKKINGLHLNDSNVLWIRAVDKVGDKSAFMPSHKIFVKKPVSDVLVINGIQSSFQRAAIQSFYLPSISNALAAPYDTLQAAEIVNNSYTELSPDPFTQNKVFGFFKKMFWFGDNMDFTMGLLQKSTTDFFNKGGKLMVVNGTNDIMPIDPPYFDFSPVRTLLDVNSNFYFYIFKDSLLPVNAGWPVLATTSFESGIRPANLQINTSGSDYFPLYNGKITNDSAGNVRPWKGNSTLICSRKRKSDGKTDFIMSLVPLHRYNALGNIDAFMLRALKTELEF